MSKDNDWELRELTDEEIHFSDRALDKNGNYPGEAEVGLDKFINSLPGRLAGFTTQQLQDEIYRRIFEPYQTALKEMKDTLDKIVSPF